MADREEHVRVRSIDLVSHDKLNFLSDDRVRIGEPVLTIVLFGVKIKTIVADAKIVYAIIVWIIIDLAIIAYASILA